MRTYIHCTLLGLLLGVGLGAAAVAQALSCAAPRADVRLALVGITVDGEAAALETGPPVTSLSYSAEDIDEGVFWDAHVLKVGDEGATTFISMDYTP